MIISYADVTTRVARLVGSSDHPAGLGRTMLVLTGVITAVTAPLLGLTDRGWVALAAISAAMLAAIGISIRVDWDRSGRSSLLAFPLLVMTALIVMGVVVPTHFAPLTGLLVFAFVYVGLTQPAGTSLCLTPFAAGCYLLVAGEFDATVFVRLLVAVLVWIFLGELLAQMTARRRRLTDALERAAHSDVLTGVGNRRDWDEQLRLAAPGTTVVICDLDHFKAVNDNFGHARGDEMLTAFGTLLLAQLRSQDYCARFGGEEFGLLLRETEADDAAAILARLHQAWLLVEPGSTFSAGLAACRSGRDNLATLRAADTALYAAKSAGRNTDRIDAWATSATS